MSTTGAGVSWWTHLVGSVKKEMTYLGLTAQEAEKRERATQLREWGWGPCFLVGQLHTEFHVTRPVHVCLPHVPPSALSEGQGQW